MEYLTLVYRNADVEMTSRLFESYSALTKELREEGVMSGGNPLQPSATASCIRRDGKKVTAEKGAFRSDSHELVGYFILNCPNDKEAQAVAGRIPDAAHGLVEIRPILEH